MGLKTIYYGLLASCLVILLSRWKRIPNYYWWFIPMIALALAIEQLKEIAPDINFLLKRLYQPVECLLLFGFYHNLFITKRKKTFTLVAYMIYLIVVIVYFGFYQKIHATSDYFDFIVEAFIVCILVALFFFELLDYKDDVNLLTYGAFWINAANFIFYGGCFFAMAYYAQLSQSDSVLAKELRSVPKYLNLFLYTVYALVFGFVKKTGPHV